MTRIRAWTCKSSSYLRALGEEWPFKKTPPAGRFTAPVCAPKRKGGERFALRVEPVTPRPARGPSENRRANLSVTGHAIVCSILDYSTSCPTKILRAFGCEPVSAAAGPNGQQGPVDKEVWLRSPRNGLVVG
jgi:hypothetical protein